MFEDFFSREKTTKTFETKGIDPDYIPVESAKDLLSEEHSQIMLNKLKALLTLPEEVHSYDKLCTEALLNYAEFVQRLPETDLGYYSKPGGLLEHALERTYLASKKVRKFLSPDSNENEKLSKESALWMYVVFTASLYYQIGYSILKLIVTVHDTATGESERWDPYMASMPERGTHYKYEFEKMNRYLQSRTVTVLLARQLLPMEGFLWIASDRDVFDVWLALLNEEWDQVGSLKGYIPYADAEATQNNLFKKELPSELRFLDNEALLEIKDRKSTKMFSEDKSALVDQSSINNRQSKFQKTTAEMTDAMNQAGEAFLKWLQEAIADGKISVNKSKSPVQVLREGVLLSYPVLFNSFLASNPGYGNWRNVLSKFLDLGITSTDVNNNHIMQYKIGTGDSQSVVKGVIVKNPGNVFRNGIPNHTGVAVSAFNRPAIPMRTPQAQGGASAQAQATMSPDAPRGL